MVLVYLYMNHIYHPYVIYWNYGNPSVDIAIVKKRYSNTECVLNA